MDTSKSLSSQTCDDDSSYASNGCSFDSQQNESVSLSVDSSGGDIYAIFDPTNPSLALPPSEPINSSKRYINSCIAIDKLHWTPLQYVTYRNALRWVIILFCLYWFIVNSRIILREFNDHDTLVFLDYQPPNVSKPPAVTVCSHCILCS